MWRCPAVDAQWRLKGHPELGVEEVALVISGTQDASTELFAEPNY